ncbi:predicted protein [Naegleria gruberi]|uniref:Predicted protein n=1 Tax=Naegleria gruberi TaxID=5762 RepID=D2V566_NAEGR|nr:uncharacterized protein NAEGRDRAFT_64030 [Naegleria gruberi]EFC48223.1 predicted protein [Naegleria gruberi]|eukprot:XP_002680967.1 predicted protein [Naegleria gruberi strain NEG-M]
MSITPTREAVLLSYRNIYRILRTTRELTGSTEALKYVQSQFRANKQNPEMFKKAKLYEGYVTTLKDYSELIQMYKVGKYEPTLNDLLKKSATIAGVSLTPKSQN